MSQFEDLEVNPEKSDHHRIYLYPASGTLEQEIGEELRAMMNVGIPDMRICLFDQPDLEIEHFDVLIEFSHQVAPEFSPDDEVYVFDEAKTDADIGDELFNRLMKLKKGTEIRIQKQEIL
ncbi:hypothetical protein CBG25_01735 [Arsenophonus sp. ENCA]|uniref:hypothetical protein n=1 Tax=Arsenophonus sp. ENCA TaxID=1987579 RepID=UPI000BC59B3F|nr:hypothetical protein [Arsenophonus sp. ENCA]PAV10514.1 hypothetical protein CBG25_01735 [Arsenophonus sp. ENCA]